MEVEGGESGVFDVEVEDVMVVEGGGRWWWKMVVVKVEFLTWKWKM